MLQGPNISQLLGTADTRSGEVEEQFYCESGEEQIQVVLEADEDGQTGAGWAAPTGIRKAICRRDEESVSDWKQTRSFRRQATGPL